MVAESGMQNDGVLENVRFERPMVEHIRKSGLHAVDMHFHTNHSDAYTKVQSALTLAKKKGVGLAITDHDTPSGVVSCAFSSCRDDKGNSPRTRGGSNRYTNYMSHASPCSATSTSACGYRPRTRSVRTRRRRIAATPNRRTTKPSAGMVNGFPSSGPRKPNEFGASGVPPPCEPITITERAMKSKSPPASRTSKRME